MADRSLPAHNTMVGKCSACYFRGVLTLVGFRWLCGHCRRAGR